MQCGEEIECLMVVTMKICILLDNDEEILWKKEMLGIWGFTQGFFYVRIFFNMIAISWFLLEKVNGSFQKHGSLRLTLLLEENLEKWTGVMDLKTLFPYSVRFQGWTT